MDAEQNSQLVWWVSVLSGQVILINNMCYYTHFVDDYSNILLVDFGNPACYFCNQTQIYITY